MSYLTKFELNNPGSPLNTGQTAVTSTTSTYDPGVELSTSADPDFRVGFAFMPGSVELHFEGTN